MKKTIIIMAAMLMGAATLSGQTIKGSYFMEGSTVRGAFNPAFRPYKGYISIPVLGGIDLGYRSNALALNDIFYPDGNGNLKSFLDASVTANQILPSLKETNSLGVNLNTTVLGFGMPIVGDRGFLTFEVDANVEMGFDLPKGLFEFMKLGSGEDGTEYNLTDFSLGANLYSTISAGYSHRFPELNLTVGGRINTLWGLARARMHFDRLNLRLMENEWSVESKGNLDVALKGFEVEEDEDGYIDTGSLSDDILDNLGGISGFGMTIDLGAEYLLLDMVKVSASVMDLGFMKWGSGNVSSAINDAKYSFTGFDIVEGEDANSSEQGDFKDFTRFRKGDPKDLRPKMRATFVLGAEAPIPYVEDYLKFGLMYMNKKTEYTHRSEVSAILTATPLSWLSASLSYTIGKTSTLGDNFLNTIGCSVNVHAKWINFFLGSDYIFTRIAPQFVPINQRAFNLHMGISIPIGTRNYNPKSEKYIYM